MDKKFIQLINEEQFQEEFFNSDSDSRLEYFGPIGDINILVGANNSRKSRFMRGLLKKVNFVQVSKEISKQFEKLENVVESLTNKISPVQPYLFRVEIIKPKGKDLSNSDNDLAPLIDLIKSGNPEFQTLDDGFFEKDLKIMKKFFSGISGGMSDKKKQFSKYLGDKLNLIQVILSYKKLLEKYSYQGSLMDSIKIDKPENIPIIIKELEELQEILNEIKNVQWEFPTPSKKFIPTLRTAISLYEGENTVEKKIKNEIEKNLYVDTIRRHYGIVYKGEGNIELFTGIDLYKRIKKDRNSRREIRKRFDAFEDFLKENFFDGKNIDIIAVEEDTPEQEHIQIFIKGEEDRYLHDLGDGIQALIILMYPIFMAEENSWIFIEEPELNMHPGLQHLFLNTITSDERIKERNLTFFISTHSNHLLNLSLSHSDKISIFSFEKISNKNAQYSKIHKVMGNDINVLDLLGVYNASVFMANCSIWVEGITDRRYISAFLNAYIRDTSQKTKFVEDMHYSFFEYAGSNLQHYLFSENTNNTGNDLEKIKAHFLSNRIFLLSDQDESPEKQRRHENLERWQNKSFAYRTTGAIEIENLISADILKLILTNILNIDQEAVDKLAFSEDDYKDIRLADFIKKKLKNKKGINLPQIQAEKNKSGTLSTNYKNKISQFVSEKINDGKITWKMISKNPDAKVLIEDIYEFIKKHNSSFN